MSEALGLTLNGLSKSDIFSMGALVIFFFRRWKARKAKEAKMRHFTCGVLFLVGLCVVVGTSAPTRAQDCSSNGLYDPFQVLRFDITMDPGDWDLLLMKVSFT